MLTPSWISAIVQQQPSTAEVKANMKFQPASVDREGKSRSHPTIFKIKRMFFERICPQGRETRQNLSDRICQSLSKTAAEYNAWFGLPVQF